MNKNWIRVVLAIILPMTAVLAGCSAKAGAGTSMKVKITAANYGASSLMRGPRTTLTATNTNNGTDGVTAQGLGMMSGPPLAMTVYLQSVQATVTGGSPVTLWSSTASNTSASGYTVTGCPIALTSGNPDISGCTGLSALTVPAGTYSGLTLTFARVGDIQGCLQGKFAMSATGASASFSYPSPPFTSGNSFSYTTDTLTGGTLYTYCTRSDQSVFNAETASTTAIGNDASYWPTASHFSGLTEPDFVSIDLGGGNYNAATMAALEGATVTINSATAPTSSTSTLTLAVDMNRMLEFFGNVRTDFNPPTPDSHTGTSYFFTTKFIATGGPTAASAITAFAGEVGTIEGYQWTAHQGTIGGPAQASGWFTFYLDASGNYLSGVMYEDDDNESTVMKGNATIASGTIATSATITLDIAGSLAGFSATAVNGTGTATLTANSTTYPVSYQRLL